MNRCCKRAKGRIWEKATGKGRICDGCFTHNRFDDSFRKTHPAYNASI